MAEVRDLTVRIKGDTSGFNKAMSEVTGESQKSTSGFGKLAAAVGLGSIAANLATSALSGLKDQFMSTFAAADESNKIQTQLNSVIKSTGGIAGVTAEKANELAKSIQRNTTINDEAIGVAENMLLTFTNIGQTTFPQATQAVADMATAMNNGATPSAEALSNTAIQVGKALNDPIKGVSALRRVGVQLSDTQKDQVEKFMAVNDIAGAQKIILDELAKEFGGSAAAAAQTFSGKMQQIGNRIDDVKESIGIFMQEQLVNLATRLQAFVQSDSFQKWLADVKEMARQMGETFKVYILPVLQFLWNFIVSQLKPAFAELSAVLEPYMPQLKMLAGLFFAALITPLVVAVVAIGAFVAALAVVIRIIAEVATAFSNLKKSITDSISRAVDSVNHLRNTISDSVSNFGSLLYNAGRDLIQGLINGIKSQVGDVGRTIEGVGSGAVNKMKNILGIHSPSTVFAEIGTNIVAGMSEGIASSQGSAGQAVSNLADTSVKAAPEASSMPATSNSTINVTVNMGMYAGMPVEKRQIGLELYKEIVRAARAQGVSLPMIGAITPQ